jgi:hypothetical protein
MTWKPPKRTIDRAQVERAARMYHTRVDAARALGIGPHSFYRLCRRYHIPVPHRGPTDG